MPRESSPQGFAEDQLLGMERQPPGVLDQLVQPLEQEGLKPPELLQVRLYGL